MVLASTVGLWHECTTDRVAPAGQTSAALGSTVAKKRPKETEPTQPDCSITVTKGHLNISDSFGQKCWSLLNLSDMVTDKHMCLCLKCLNEQDNLCLPLTPEIRRQLHVLAHNEKVMSRDRHFCCECLMLSLP